MRDIIALILIVAATSGFGYWRGGQDATAGMKAATAALEARLEEQAQIHTEELEHTRITLEETLRNAENNVVLRPCLDAGSVRALNAIR